MNPSRLSALAIVSLFAFSASASAAPVEEGDLVSPFPSTVEGLSIPNAHLVGKSRGAVYRGMSPLTNKSDRLGELIAKGVTDVVIFKDEVKGDVSRETSELSKNYGVPLENIHSIPFRWRDVHSYREACEQMIDALQVLETAYNSPGRAAYFHCTVGEDRTGMLAGIFKMVEMKNQGWTARKAFEEEMCLNGYEAGNPQKPANVVATIRQELTPIFLKLATLIERGKISAGHLDRSACAKNVKPRYRTADFACKASPLYRAQ